MNSWILPIAVLVVLALATAVLSLMAFVRAGFAIKAATELNEDGWKEASARMDQVEAALQTQFQARLDELAVQIARASTLAAPGAQLAPAMNLNKRSQALRLHRRGDPPEAIAEALGLPVQEVDLLVKVHRIVLQVL